MLLEQKGYTLGDLPHNHEQGEDNGLETELKCDLEATDFYTLAMV